MAETLFTRALELPAGAVREEFLLRQCGHDAALQNEVRSLLEAHEQAGSFLRAAPDIPAQPPRVPGYRLEGRLGQGGLGVVYAAHDEKLNRPVAIKVLHPQADAQVRRRVLEEARHAAALADPAIVTIYSVLDEIDPPAIVMERLEGFPLDRFAAELNFEQKARLLREVARGLSVAHQHGLLHRDLTEKSVAWTTSEAKGIAAKKHKRRTTTRPSALFAPFRGHFSVFNPTDSSVSRRTSSSGRTCARAFSISASP
jgi:serine/threonine protein kinase